MNDSLHFPFVIRFNESFAHKFIRHSCLDERMTTHARVHMATPPRAQSNSLSIPHHQSDPPPLSFIRSFIHVSNQSKCNKIENNKQNGKPVRAYWGGERLNIKITNFVTRTIKNGFILFKCMVAFMQKARPHSIYDRVAIGCLFIY